jgi:predicted 3-demethylubiquinone-9 3-methyltransferase (glyoxalase superfamily)
MPQPIVPNLWFDTEAEEAAEYYVSLFPDSRILSSQRYTDAGPGEPGTVMTIEFELMGRPYIAINGGPQFPFSEAVSFMITCRDQAEVDHYWERLTDGGEESMCGWCKDRFGFSWQVIPEGFGDVFAHPDPDAAQRVMQAMLKMRKLDLAALQRAADGTDV